MPGNQRLHQWQIVVCGQTLDRIRLPKSSSNRKLYLESGALSRLALSGLHREIKFGWVLRSRRSPAQLRFSPALELGETTERRSWVFAAKFPKLPERFLLVASKRSRRRGNAL